GGTSSNFRSNIDKFKALGMNFDRMSRKSVDVPISRDAMVSPVIFLGISLTLTPVGSDSDARATDLQGDSKLKPPGRVMLFRIMPSSSSRACPLTLRRPGMAFYSLITGN